jgi:transcription-repair coupling factor (superfamily II helicase)
MFFHKLAKEYSETEEISELVKAINENEKPVSIEGIPFPAFSLAAASLREKFSRPVVIITKNNTKIYEIANDLSSFIPEELITPFPSFDILPYEFISPVDKILKERITALYRMLSGDNYVFITCAESLMRKIPAKSNIEKKALFLNKGSECSFESLERILSSFGYTRESSAETYGSFAVKGGIIDVFPSSLDYPVRLDFFGDTIESIREFDPETQRSTNELSSVTILPRKELILSEDEKEKLKSFLKSERIKGNKLPEEIIHILENKSSEKFPGIEDYFHAVIDSVSPVEYLPTDSLYISCEKHEIDYFAESMISSYRAVYEQKSKNQFALPADTLFSETEFKNVLAASVNLQTLTSSPDAVHLSLKAIHSFAGKLQTVREEFKTRIEHGWKISAATVFEGQIRRLSDIFKEFSPDDNYENPDFTKNLSLAISPLSGGIYIGATKRAIFTDHDIFGKSYKKRRSFKSGKSKAIDSFLDLSPGDRVVHVNHGIGIFTDIERMSAGGIEKDYIVLEYAGGDKLFVALDQLNMIQKYTGIDGREARIDSLGKKSAWNRIKQKVQETVDEIAEELIAIYARRKQHKGFRFPSDTVWQEEFEARFEYEETADQMSAIEDVKDDMEKESPMDRLVCGDVGFGKTEVAIRAAFKAAMSGKQTAILVPTTILALQHFNNFKKRYEGYPVEIDMISRFRSSADIRRTKQGLSNGEIDIIIGTHAILSEDTFIKNLGLLIIDEEQRFGVKHKEKLKKYRSQVDVLTLSATPIPRTLHMSLAGIRGLSIISTPPENRQAIETFVLEDNPEIIKMAIERELERNGQLFYVHNRVQDMEKKTDFIKSLVPEARVAVAHGQMEEHELENIMIDFLEYKYDILLSTTIIESGVDMPRVNTIIVDRADAFGLSQLYQLKGRVGRSDKQAYAYFFYPRHMVINETAMKRLNVISEFTELGSGFKVAMRDMEIRGAGNLLGREQSGCIVDVGFDLYCAMLEEAVRKIKGEKPLKLFRTPVFFNINTFIPDSYISDTRQKIEFYKKFESCETDEEITKLCTDMKDRFGAIPDEVETLIEIQRLRTLASSVYLEEIIETEKYIRIKISKDTTLDLPALFVAVKSDKRFKIDPDDQSAILLFSKEEESEKKLLEVKKWLQQMLPQSH